MALMKPGPLGTVSGALGSIVFAVKRGSVTVSQPKQHTSRTSTLAYAARSEAATWSRAWLHSDMDAYRNAWQVYANNHPVAGRFGQPRYRTAKQEFLHFVPQMKVLGVTASPPPDAQEYFHFSTVDINFNTITGLTLTLGTPIGIPNLVLVLYVSRWAGPYLWSKRPSWLAPPTPPQLFSVYSYGPALATMGCIPSPGERWRLKLVMSRITGPVQQIMHVMTDPCVVP